MLSLILWTAAIAAGGFGPMVYVQEREAGARGGILLALYSVAVAISGAAVAFAIIFGLAFLFTIGG